jgi:hypothetical protein
VARFQRKGPGPTTRLLRDAIARAGLASGSLLDVGAGIGGLTLELLALGTTRAVIVEASSAYLEAAMEEAARRGQSAIQFVPGDFAALADQLPAATVVALDRVVCCYPLYGPLLEAAVRHAERGIAFSYPRDRWYVRLGVWLENAMRRRRGNPFRTVVHPPHAMHALLERSGFKLASRSGTVAWSVDVFLRRTA